MPEYGCWLDLPSPQVAEIIAQTGFDFIVVDLEHGPTSVETAQVTRDSSVAMASGPGTWTWHIWETSKRPARSRPAPTPSGSARDWRTCGNGWGAGPSRNDDRPAFPAAADRVPGGPQPDSRATRQ